MTLESTIEQYADWITALDLRLYQPTFAADYLLLNWWVQLCETGDIKRLLIKGSRKLSSFYSVFSPPTITLYTCGADDKIDFVSWLKPASTAADEQTVLASFWADASIRGNRKHSHLTYLIYSMIFTLWNNVLGTTWQADLIRVHKKVGYELVGVLPEAYGEQHIYLMHLTQEGFVNSRFHNIYLRRRAK